MKTTEIKKVLIAMDYDETAQIVAENGFLLAQKLKADVILLHVISDQPMYYSAYDYMRELKVDIIPDLIKSTQRFLNKTKKYLGDESIQTILKEGEAAGMILDTAKELGADLIVMGSHSRKWLENIIMGSVTEAVLRKTVVPLFIVPTKKQKES